MLDGGDDRQRAGRPQDAAALSAARAMARDGEELLQLAFTAMQDVRELRDAQGQSDASRSAEACLAAQVALLQQILAQQRDTIERLITAPTALTPALSKTWLVVNYEGFLVGVSDDACGILKRTREDLIGTLLTDVVVADAAAIRTALRRAFRDGHAHVPAHLPGSNQDVRLTLQRIPDRSDGTRRLVVEATPAGQTHWTAANADADPAL